MEYDEVYDGTLSFFSQEPRGGGCVENESWSWEYSTWHAAEDRMV